MVLGVDSSNTRFYSFTEQVFMLFPDWLSRCPILEKLGASFLVSKSVLQTFVFFGFTCLLNKVPFFEIRNRMNAPHLRGEKLEYSSRMSSLFIAVSVSSCKSILKKCPRKKQRNLWSSKLVCHHSCILKCSTITTRVLFKPIHASGKQVSELLQKNGFRAPFLRVPSCKTSRSRKFCIKIVERMTFFLTHVHPHRSTPKTRWKKGPQVMRYCLREDSIS